GQPVAGNYKFSVFDLYAYAGQKVQMRLMFRSDSSWTSVGAYIDEIRVDEENSDPDGDGLSGILAEFVAYGTDPFLADTDGDGVSDSREVAAGTDPLLASSLPAPVFSGTASVRTFAGLAPDDLYAFDINNDGYSDVLLTGLTPGSNVYAMNGDGTGAMAAATALASPRLSAAYRLTVGDLNGDGYGDLVVASNAASGVDLYVMVNNQNGSFAAPVAYQDGSAFTTQARSVAVADLNGDSYQDVVVGFMNDLYTSVFLGSANGTLTAHGSYARLDRGRAVHLAVADFNSDGVIDVADSGGLALGDGTGALGMPSSLGFAVGINATDMTTADLNGDGYADLVVGNIDTTISAGQMTVLLGNGDGTFGAAATTTTGSTGSSGVDIGDLNLDGKPDIAFADSNSSIIYIYQGNGDGTFIAKTSVVSTGAKGVQITDMNNDGKLDLVVYESTGTARVWLNTTP
ncbi:MAG: FG-GAP-like repeat-containing protein, partial [Mariprofundales bacterium]